MSVVLSTAYWPNLHYFHYVVCNGAIVIDEKERYRKQSYRNRCRILSANGPLDLVVPVKHNNPLDPVDLIELSYMERWAARHQKAIKSAYGKTAFYSYFEEEILGVYDKKWERLVDLNREQLKLLVKLFRLRTEISYADNEVTREVSPLKEIIHPKKEFTFDPNVGNLLKKPYQQAFTDRFAFVPNLSILDLLFNEGPKAVSSLQEIQRSTR